MITEWENGIRKSILITGACLMFQAFALPTEIFTKIFVVHWIILIPFHFMLSVTGWFLVGMPCYWVANKYTNSGLLICIGAAITIACILWLSVGEILGPVVVIMPVIQCLIFVYYLNFNGKKWSARNEST